jgi:hypothetical protein
MTATLKRRVVAEFSDRSRGARPRLIIQSTWPQEPHPCEASGVPSDRSMFVERPGRESTNPSARLPRCLLQYMSQNLPGPQQRGDIQRGHRPAKVEPLHLITVLLLEIFLLLARLHPFGNAGDP